MSRKQLPSIKRSPRGQTGLFLRGLCEYASTTYFYYKTTETRARHGFKRMASILRHRILTGYTGSLGSLLYNVREMSKNVIYVERVGTTPSDPVNPVSDLRMPDNGSFHELHIAGNSRLDFPGMGLVWNRFTLHTMRVL